MQSHNSLFLSYFWEGERALPHCTCYFQTWLRKIPLLQRAEARSLFLHQNPISLWHITSAPWREQNVRMCYISWFVSQSHIFSPSICPVILPRGKQSQNLLEWAVAGKPICSWDEAWVDFCRAYLVVITYQEVLGSRAI